MIADRGENSNGVRIEVIPFYGVVTILEVGELMGLAPAGLTVELLQDGLPCLL